MPAGGARGALAVAVRGVAAPVVGATLVTEFQGAGRRAAWTLESYK